MDLILLQVTAKLTALKGLDARLREIRSYLDLVIEGKLPLNHEILYHLQVGTCIVFFICSDSTIHGSKLLDIFQISVVFALCKFIATLSAIVDFI